MAGGAITVETATGLKAYWSSDGTARGALTPLVQGGSAFGVETGNDLSVSWRSPSGELSPVGGGVSPTPVPVNTALPAITGTAQEGQILTASTGTWTNNPTVYAYQWKRNGVAISGSINATRTLNGSDVGAVMSSTVTATNAGGSASADSAATTAVIAASVQFPVNTVAPAVTGTGTIGQVLTSDNGTWSNSPTSYAYVWRRGGVDIAGATAATYTLVSADAGTLVTCRVFATNAGGTAGATSSAISVAGTFAVSSVNSDGWSAQWNPAYGALPAYSTNVTEFDPEGAGKIAVPFVAPGFDDHGVATTIAQTRTITKEVHKTWTAAGAHLTADGLRVAMDNFVLQGETQPGNPSFVNNSTRTGYKPIAQPQTRNRRVVGNTAYVQVAAAHRSGRNQRPVACVKAWYRSEDGTKQTNKVELSGPKVLAGIKDQHAVIGYDGDIPTETWRDGTAIADGTNIVREFEIFPFVGTLIATTVGGTVDGRGFVPLTDYKHTVRLNTPIHTSVAPTGGAGVDETVNAAGVGTTTGLQKVSADIAMSRANPFATESSALQALKAATALTGGFTDGCFVNFRAGAHAASGNTLVGTYQQGAEVTFRTDPADAAYSAVLTFSGYQAYRHSWIAYRNMTLVKGVTASGPAANPRILDCKADGGGFNSAFLNAAAWVSGLEVGNVPAVTTFLLSGTFAAQMMRGIKATGIVIDGYNVSGSRLVNCTLQNSTRSSSGMMWNGVSNIGGTATVESGDAATTVEGVAWINTIVTNVGTASNVLISASRDNLGFDIRHFIRWGLTELGTGDVGRRNEGYDETTGTVRRNNEFWDERGVIAAAAYHKTDQFFGANKAGTEAECALRTGSWSVSYGVGRRGVWHLTEPNANTGPNFGPGGSENRAFFGIKVKTLAGRTSPYTVNDPKFVGGYQKASYWDGAAVQAGSLSAVAEDFMLLDSSPAIGVLTSAEEAIPFDIAGVARTRGTLGAYA